MFELILVMFTDSKPWMTDRQTVDFVDFRASLVCRRSDISLLIWWYTIHYQNISLYFYKNESALQCEGKHCLPAKGSMYCELWPLTGYWSYSLVYCTVLNRTELYGKYCTVFHCVVLWPVTGYWWSSLLLTKSVAQISKIVTDKLNRWSCLQYFGLYKMITNSHMNIEYWT